MFLPARASRPRNGFRRAASLPLLASAGLLFLLFSCAGSAPKGTSPFPYEALKKSSEHRNNISGTIRITQTVEGKSVTIPGVLLASWPGSLRLELQDPVGSVLALLLVEGDKFWLYQQNRKENLTGPIEKLPAGISLPFVAEDLVRVILARPDLDRFKAAPAEGNRTELKEGKGLESLTWSPDRFQIQEWMKKIPGEPLSRAAYEGYTSRAGGLYPTKIRLTSGVGERSERSALLVWVDWEPSVFDKKLFQIPPSRDFGRKTKALP